MKTYKSYYLRESRKKKWRAYAIGATIWTTVFFMFYLYLRATSYHVRYPDPTRLSIYLSLDRYLFIWWGGGLSITVLIIAVILYRKMAHSLDEVLDFMKTLWENPDKRLEISPGADAIYHLMNYFQGRLQDTTKAIRQEQQRKNDLVVYLAHDLKTPLTSVEGYLDILMEQPELPEELKLKYTGIALEKAQRLEELIDEFFEISRFNLTEIVLKCKNVNMNRLIEQEIFEFEPMLREKSLTCSTNIPENFNCVCDPDKIQRAIDNLLRNAVNYSYPESVITLKAAEDGGNYRIIITNHGDTIPQESLDRIFEQFFRLDTSRSSKTGGSGIGLAVAKKIMEAHSGTITAESADSQIVFTIIWPVRSVS